MNKVKLTYFLISIIMLMLVLFLYVFFPREIEHGILVNSDSASTSFYVNGKLISFKTNQLSFSKNTVLNFKYNRIKAYGFQEVIPIADRVMIKGSNSYDLEKEGSVALAKKASYYQIDKDYNLIPSKSDKLIIGKNNVKIYKDRKGNLKTFMLTPMDFSMMRVAISTTNFSSKYHDKLSFKTSSPVKLYSIRENFSAELADRTSITVEKSESEFKVKWGDNEKTFTQRIYLQGDGISFSSISRGSPTFTPSYSGILEITSSKEGLLVVNEVSLEEYLSKVVPSEMPASSAPESLKCQSIAARTYAISDMLGNRYGNLGFYVDDSTMSQVYNNTPVYQRSTDAVNQTKGLIMTYNGEPIDAKYYSTSAGTGVTYRDIWFKGNWESEDKPYFVTSSYLSTKRILPNTEADWLSFYKDKTIKAFDSSSPYFRWQIEFPEAALTKSLNKSLKSTFEKKKDFISITQEGKSVREFSELNNLKDIKVTKRSEGGNILQMSFVFDNATVDIWSDSVIRSAIKCSKEYADESIPIIRLSGSPITNSTSLPSSFFSVEKVNDKFMFYGGGYGHGVGMSQYAAMEMGKSGMDYKTILDTFYKNIKIDELY